MKLEIVLLISVIAVHCNTAPINMVQGRGFSMALNSDTNSDDDDLPITSSKVIEKADGSRGIEINLDFSRGGKVGGKSSGGKVIDLTSIINALFQKASLNPQMGSSGGLPPSFGSPQNMAGGKVMPVQVGGSGGGPPPGWVMRSMKSGGSGGPHPASLNNRQGPVPTTTTTTTPKTTQAPASNNDEDAEEILDDKK